MNRRGASRWLLTRTAAGVAVTLAAVAVIVVLALGGDDPTPTAGTAQADARGKLPPGRPFTLVWAGDTTLGSDRGLPPERGWVLFKDVASTLRGADITAVNLEGTLGTETGSKCQGTSENCFAFQGPPVNARSLGRAGVDVVNLANNHAFDFGPTGMGATTRALKRADVRFTGRPGELAVLKLPKARIGFLGFAAYPWAGPITNLDAVRRLVALAATKANVVVVFFHGGAEGPDKTRTPVGTEIAFGEDRGDVRAFARAAIDAGADAVLGSGPHVLRGMERYKGRLVAYSLANLAGYENFGTGGTLSLSGALRLRFDADGRVASGRFRALRLDAKGIPHPDRSGDSRRLVNAVGRQDFGAAAVTIRPNGRLKLP